MVCKGRLTRRIKIDRDPHKAGCTTKEMVAVAGPLEQFEIKPLAEMQVAGIDVSFTNSSLWMVIVVTALTFFLVGGTRKNALVPGRWQAMVEMAYEFIANMVKENVGREGKQYFPFIFTLFMFILGSNLAGMIPYSFTTTSHIIVTFALAAVVFLGVTLIGFAKHGLGFLKLFAPSGVPAPLYILIVPIEVMSYFTRPISLSVRLFANMLAGHIMMKVFAGFIISLGAIGIAGQAAAVLPFAFNIFLTGLEILVAFLQAYVFAILSCIYLHDAMHPAH
ncbi:ATP synthase F0 subcomplex A subunit [Kordiimonas lacus]|jgi:F-type H+-transporting ATPase subunit a|uniref:ATP synthase subunit a n=2 Tax=Kordiimonadaceae TaxID=1331809 RepID=A0A1G7B163_9PROT|nr:ATP synthase F0 subcomplex A subunit [Kordiimonas lacus]